MLTAVSQTLDASFRTFVFIAPVSEHSLDSHDLITLRAAHGWLELDMPREALVELEKLPQHASEHVDVLEVRWAILAEIRDWDEAVKISEKLVQCAPDRVTSWLHHAYSTRRAKNGSLLAAYHLLAGVASQFPAEVTVAYNLACYTCQLNREQTETMSWFEQALRLGDPAHVCAMALEDCDLRPVHDVIGSIAAQKGWASPKKR